jgi:uncharacterized protein (TIGR03437 family)
VTFYATGVGPTSPCVDGATYQSNFPTLTLPVIVGVGRFGARVLYGGQAPNLVSGVAQFNIVIPSDATTGVVPLTLVVGGIFSPSGATIASSYSPTWQTFRDRHDSHQENRLKL